MLTPRRTLSRMSREDTSNDGMSRVKTLSRNLGLTSSIEKPGRGSDHEPALGEKLVRELPRRELREAVRTRR